MMTAGFSHKITPESLKLFETLHAQLGGCKREVLELIIRTFAALPQKVQDNLASKRPGVAEAEFARLSEFGTESASVDTLARDVQSQRDRTHRKRGPKQAS
jgi:hypothetical protein